MKILITGFDPFGGETVNPSWEAVNLLPDTIKGIDLIKAQLPTVYGKAGERLRKLINQHHPTAVICVGQAGGRSAVTVERVAINVRDAKSPDNEGTVCSDQPICPEGPTAYFSTLPLKKIVSAMEREGIPAAVSNSAGTFVCNDVLYTLLSRAQEDKTLKYCGFIHVPYTEEQAKNKPSNPPCMPLSTIVRGLEISLRVIAEEQERIPPQKE